MKAMIVPEDEPYVTLYCQECGINSITYDVREPHIPFVGDYYICDECLNKRNHWIPDQSMDRDDDFYYDARDGSGEEDPIDLDEVY